jgi:hypothetical protein
MVRGFAFPSALIVCTLCSQARAVDFSFQGYADLRVIAPADEKSWLDGGLGKFRYGSAQPDPDFTFPEAVGQGTLSLADDLRLVATARVEPRQRSGIDLLDAYVVYTPGAEDDWHWSAKAGAFFPPFALENADLGWTSPYTLTPSAINSWIGDELRTIGGEASVMRQTGIGTWSLTASLFCCNDPAGVLIANGGWTLDDRPSGLFETLPTPGTSPIVRTPLFRELDNRAGWYVGAAWSLAGIGKLSLYRYDNDADAMITRGNASGWRTDFWSAGWETHAGAWSVLAQGLAGRTVIAFLGGSAATKFESAYALAAYDIDSDWRVAARAEIFGTMAGPDSPYSEHGHAFTAAVSWTPKAWIRVTGEIIALDSTRGERTFFGMSPQQSQTQFQLNGRFFI